jgi:MinD superfamily P-loop ATPase
MKQIVIISGKGGTGKTVITATFAALLKNKILADCDVDAADLHLLLDPVIKKRHVFRSGMTAIIDKDKCIQCGKCIKLCRFSAINKNFTVNGISCEGCNFCSFACPVGAIKMEENISGEWFISHTRFGPLVHAKLGIAEENSGKLVSLVRKQAKELADKNQADWIIIDGAPGIGCPVIASFSGIDYAIVVTEPTLSGLHDADRIINTAKHFGINTKLIINKYDLNPAITEKIELYCSVNKLDLLGKVPFDKTVVESMVKGITIPEHTAGPAKKALEKILNNLQKKLAKN